MSYATRTGAAASGPVDCLLGRPESMDAWRLAGGEDLTSGPDDGRRMVRGIGLAILLSVPLWVALAFGFRWLLHAF
jgi:hypothetical protein